jgi:small-conductance mechanosensitive channel
MKKVVTALLLVTPMLSSAQALAQINTLAGAFGAIVNVLIPIMMALAVLAFFWGLVKYIASASDEAAKESGKNLMIWGMIALFVMVALWGILGWVQSNLGLSGTVITTAPPAFIVPTT